MDFNIIYNKKYFMCILIIILLLYYITKKDKYEHNTNVSSSSEAISNIASMYNSQKLISTHLNLTGDLNMISEGSLLKTQNNPSGIKFNDIVTKINKTSSDLETLKTKFAVLDNRLLTQKKMGGFAINGDGSTMMLFEGGPYSLENNELFDMWTTNKWDAIYLFKGWKIQLWRDANAMGPAQTNEENINSDIKKIFLGSNNNIGVDQASAYKLEWIGY
jgi:hypothetical protein